MQNMSIWTDHELSLLCVMMTETPLLIDRKHIEPTCIQTGHHIHRLSAVFKYAHVHIHSDKCLHMTKQEGRENKQL